MSLYTLYLVAYLIKNAHWNICEALEIFYRSFIIQKTCHEIYSISHIELMLRYGPIA